MGKYLDKVSNDKIEIRLVKNDAELVAAQKLRYKIPVDKLRYELDVYQADLSPLSVLEIEFESETDAKAFIAPTWFGKEVTDDKRFSNAELAKNGIPKNNQHDFNHEF